MDSKSDEHHSKKETQRRFEAALRGAFATPPKPMKDIPPKRPKAQRGKRGKSKASSA
jgi:hypothetical protein